MREVFIQIRTLQNKEIFINTRHIQSIAVHSVTGFTIICTGPGEEDVHTTRMSIGDVMAKIKIFADVVQD